MPNHNNRFRMQPNYTKFTDITFLYWSYVFIAVMCIWKWEAPACVLGFLFFFFIFGGRAIVLTYDDICCQNQATLIALRTRPNRGIRNDSTLYLSFIDYGCGDVMSIYIYIYELFLSQNRCKYQPTSQPTNQPVNQPTNIRNTQIHC